MATPDSYVEVISATSATTTARTFAGDSLSLAPSKSASLTLTFGTGSGQVNDGGQTTLAPAASNSATINFASAAAGIFDESIAFTSVKSLLVHNASTTASCVIKGTLINAFFGTSAVAIPLKPGCFVSICNIAGATAGTLIAQNLHSANVGSVVVKYSGVE